jgi:hypothetical protein
MHPSTHSTADETEFTGKRVLVTDRTKGTGKLLPIALRNGHAHRALKKTLGLIGSPNRLIFN